MMITHTATAPPDDAVAIDADRADAGLRACLRILLLVSTLARRRSVHKLGAPCAADADTQLRGAVKDYERHVLAWYALSRSADAQAARNAIERRRRASGRHDERYVPHKPAGRPH